MALILPGFNDSIPKTKSKLFSMMCSLWSGPCFFFWFYFTLYSLPETRTNYSLLLNAHKAFTSL